VIRLLRAAAFVLIGSAIAAPAGAQRRDGGVELLSVASWRSPIAIIFRTSPIVAGGKAYQLRRMIAVRSATSFDVTEEFSVDGGPFCRLGDGHYTKTQ